MILRRPTGANSLNTSYDEIPVREIEQILHLDPSARSTRNLERLDMYFSVNNFFIEHKKKLEEKTLHLLLRNIGIYECNQDDFVFKYGEMGRLFYIILEGEVIVKTPAPHLLEGEELVNPKAVLLYLIRYFQDIDWKSLLHGN